jgi:hypothetical protein
MNDWVDDINRSKQEADDKAKIEAELALYEARKFQSLLPFWWDDIVGRVKDDARRLGRNISIKKDSHLTIELVDVHQIIRISVQPNLIAEQVRVA